MSPDIAVTVLANELRQVHFRYHHEDELQRGIAEVLTRLAVPFEREVDISPRDRLDFLTRDGICIEVKVTGTLSALTRQVFRYTVSDRVAGVLVVTNRSAHAGLASRLNDKPVVVVHLLTGIL